MVGLVVHAHGSTKSGPVFDHPWTPGNDCHSDEPICYHLDRPGSSTITKCVLLQPSMYSAPLMFGGMASAKMFRDTALAVVDFQEGPGVCIMSTINLTESAVRNHMVVLQTVDVALNDGFNPMVRITAYAGPNLAIPWFDMVQSLSWMCVMVALEGGALVMHSSLHMEVSWLRLLQLTMTRQYPGCMLKTMVAGCSRRLMLFLIQREMTYPFMCANRRVSGA